MQLGIDLGTTHTAVACADRGNYPVLTFEAPDGDTVDHVPSLVAEFEGRLYFGLEARELARTQPQASVVRSFKRVLSSPRVTADTPIRIGQTTLPALELVTRFLVALAETIRTRASLPAPVSPDEPLEAVVAVPANAFGAQRFLTLDAFRRAGIVPRALLNEPSAAGFEYVHRHHETLSSNRTTVVVYDLGGGTFDVSLVHVATGSHDVVTTAGLNDLGGDDFDEVLLRLVLESVGVIPETMEDRERARLLERCRDAKESLNANSRRVLVDLEGIDGLEGGEASIPTADYYAACEPLVRRSMEAMAPVLEAAGFDQPGSDTMAGVYVVGGGSALPVVSRVLRERFGRRLRRSPYPSAATAIGLAIAADDDTRFVLRERLTRHFGVFREGDGGGSIIFDPIFRKDDLLPRAGTATTLKRVYRPAHNWGHLRFIECQAVRPDGTPVGEVMPFADVRIPYDRGLRAQGALSAVPVQRLAAGPLMEERYDLDPEGLVAVTFTDLENGWRQSYRLGGGA